MRHTLVNDHRISETDRLRARPARPSEVVDLDAVLAIVRRQWLPAVICLLVSLGLGLAYLATAAPKFSSSASLLIDSNNQKLVDQLSVLSGVLADDSFVLNQVELLHSEKIIKAVISNQKLLSDPYFNNAAASPPSRFLNFARQAAGLQISDGNVRPKSEELLQTIIGIIDRNLEVERVGRSSVLNLTYTSTSPEFSQRIARAVADAYVADQLDARFDATRRASEWLQTRISELRQKSLETDLAVQKFRAEKGLITTDGQLVSDQQLTQINSQLIIAQADAASAQAKYNGIQSIIDSGNLGSAVTESLNSEVISDLQTKFLEASRKEADIANRLGSNHVQAVRLRIVIAEYQRLMFQELGRIAQSYKNNYQVALAREKSLETHLTKATDTSAVANDAQVQLRELERESETYKKLYETFLQRYQQAVQQQSFPVTEARLITEPSVPIKPSGPKKLAVLAIFSALGLGLGAMVGGVREFGDRGYRTAGQIADLLDLEFLGNIPKIAEDNGDPSSWEERPDDRLVGRSAAANYAMKHPLSAFAETIRSIKLAIDVSTYAQKTKVVGVVSAVPGEGKSMLSINLAQLLASQGARVVLVDGDLRKPSATRELAPRTEKGLFEVLRRESLLSKTLLIDGQTGLVFLPAVARRHIPYSAELLSGTEIDELLAQLKNHFEYIIFDLPPLAPVIDARAMSQKVDTYVLAIEWGSTPRGLVNRTWTANDEVAAKCCGAVLTKVDTKRVRLYETSQLASFGNRYNSYYTDK